MMATDKNNTCEARIGAQLAGRLETFTALVKASSIASVDDLTDAELIEATDSSDRDEWEGDRGASNLAERAQERIYELPLAVTESRMVRIDLSTGGPGDWLEAMIDSDGGFTRITYWFNDWFDSASRVLDGDDFDTAEAFIRNFIVE